MALIDLALRSRTGASEVLQEQTPSANWQAPVAALFSHLLKAVIEVSDSGNVRYLSRSEQRAMKSALYSSVRILN